MVVRDSAGRWDGDEGGGRCSAAISIPWDPLPAAITVLVATLGSCKPIEHMKKSSPARKFQYFYPHIVQTQLDRPHQPRCLSWFYMAWQNQGRCYEKVFLSPKKRTPPNCNKVWFGDSLLLQFAVLGHPVLGCKFALVMGSFTPDPLYLALGVALHC